MPPPITTLALRPPPPSRSSTALDLAGPFAPPPRILTATKLTYADGSVYEGDTLDGLRHGAGTLTTPAGDSYTGSWRLNEREGKGAAVTAGGQTYDGAWRDGLPHGQGVASYEDGGRYEGGFVKGLRSGWGEHKYGAGGSYTGQWADDAPHGQGVQVTPDCGRFEGTFTAGARAKGRWIAPGGGEEYDGEWDTATGLRSGAGVRVLPGVSTYTGAWAGDAPHGQGRCDYADGTLYEGAWEAGVRAGAGRAVFPDGSTYVGAWAGDVPHGQGRSTVGPPGAGGGWYEGAWRHGARHGQGREVTAEGEAYAGGWVDGARAGLGTAKKADGEVYSGEWARGKRHGVGQVQWAPSAGGGSWRGRWVAGKWVASPPHPRACQVTGGGVSRAVAGRGTALTLAARDAAGQGCLVGGAAVAGWLVPGPLLSVEDAVATAAAASPDAHPPGTVPVVVADAGDGTYALSYTPTAAGEASLVLVVVGGPAASHPPALLADAPYAVFVSPGPPDARACTARLHDAVGNALVTAWVDVRDGLGNAVGGDAAAAAVSATLHLGGAALPAAVEALPSGGVLLRVPAPLPGQVPVMECTAAAAALEVTVSGRHLPGTPLAVGLFGGGGGGTSAADAPVPDASRAWAARAAAALAAMGEEDDDDDDKVSSSPPLDPTGRPLDPATAAYAAAHPGVPVVEDLNDLWLVGRLQRERERKAKRASAAAAAGGLAPEEVELARQEMAAKLAAEKEETGGVGA